jgi:hypothetical protein
MTTFYDYINHTAAHYGKYLPTVCQCISNSDDLAIFPSRRYALLYLCLFLPTVMTDSGHVTVLFFFCTPVHSSAQGMIAGTDNEPFRASQRFPSPGERARPRLPGFVAASIFSTLPCLCANLFMGCRGFWKGKDMSCSSNSVEVNSPLGGVGLFSFAVLKRRVALSERHA